jgi:hypothetical protein
MHELRGKGWRVLGYFIWMLGAGIILDSHAARIGTALLLTGAALFAGGVWQSVRGETSPRS